MGRNHLLAITAFFFVGLGISRAATTQPASTATGLGSFAELPRLTLAAAEEGTTVKEEKTTVSEETSETTTVKEKKNRYTDTWDLWGPFRLRAADPEPLGEMEAKNIVHYGTSSNGEDDTTEYEFELEYGFAPNNELIFAVPLELGDGKAEGNGDLEVGWHWRLWEEKDWLPAFALRNILYIPSGYHSRGLDWTFKGLMTKSIIPDKWRLHFNPFLTVASGDPSGEGPEESGQFPFFWQKEEGDLRDFQWGFLVGTDYRLTDNLNLILDYIHETADQRGWRNQHSMEAGLEWTIDEHNHLGFATNWTVDGDHFGENWGGSISYVYDFDVPAIGK